MGIDVLFVCVHNAGRSVMAEALFNHVAGPRFRAASAGTQPSAAPHGAVVRSLSEIGIDVSGRPGRLVTDGMISSAGRVVTMGCGIDADACPAIRYATQADWALPDPADKSVEEVRVIRDEIERLVSRLVADLEAGR